MMNDCDEYQRKEGSTYKGPPFLFFILTALTALIAIRATKIQQFAVCATICASLSVTR